MIQHRPDLLLDATQKRIESLQASIESLEQAEEISRLRRMQDKAQYEQLPGWRKMFTQRPRFSDSEDFVASIRRYRQVEYYRGEIYKLMPLLVTLRFAVKQGYREIDLPFEFYSILEYL
jgi:hypothetical protein